MLDTLSGMIYKARSVEADPLPFQSPIYYSTQTLASCPFSQSLPTDRPLAKCSKSLLLLLLLIKPALLFTQPALQEIRAFLD